MLPKISGRPSYMLNIPALSGGVNKRDGISLINDNQMVTLKNMIYKDGVLKTRNSLKSLDSNYDYSLSDFFEIKKYSEINFINGKGNFILYIGKYSCGLVPFFMNESGDIERPTVINENGKLEPCDITFNISDEASLNCLPIINGNDIYFMITHEYYKYTDPRSDFYCYKAEKNQYGTYNVKKVDNIYEEAYIPTVATNFEPTTVIPIDDENPLYPYGKLAYTGTAITGYNLLTPYYKIVYSTVPADLANGEEQPMRYLLLNRLDYVFNGSKVTATITNAKTGVSTTHTVVTTDGYLWKGVAEEKVSDQDNLQMVVFPTYIEFRDKDGKVKNLTNVDYLFNNLEIMAYRSDWDTKETLHKVVNMTTSAFYGGNSKGLNGGSRLFLGGNIDENEKNLVVYSDFDNPLYFPENCYFYVGNSGEKVTAFGKQGESLIIFKEREIYCTYYTQSSSPTAEQLEEQSVIDLTTTGEYFPLVQIHGFIGCDCPDTVQLCRNKLVWLSSDGKVYNLTSPNQYSERTVFGISEMVENDIKKLPKSSLIKAKSIDYDGLYMLSIDNVIYCMDYNSYGYNYVYSYSKAEDANKLIPWYIWELPVEPMCLFSNINGLMMLANYRGVFNVFFMGDDGNEDVVPYMDGHEQTIFTKNIPIVSQIQTKSFDFGQPSFAKNVLLTSISFGYNGGQPIRVNFVTEHGKYTAGVVRMNGKASDERNAAHFTNYDIHPLAQYNVRFGIEIECEGKFEINSISLKYKVLGGTR